jgi:small subunit ribosomal protein S9
LSNDPTQDEGASPEEDAPAEEPTAPEEAAPEPEEQAAPPEEAPTEEPAADTTEAGSDPEAPEAAPEPEAPEAGSDSSTPEPEDSADDGEGSDPTVAEAESAGEAPAEKAPAEAPAADAKKKDVAPGADLEPLLIEDERELSAEERARLEAEQEEAAAAAAAETDVVAEEPAIREGAKLDLPAGTRIQATGKRKTAIARVVIAPGKGDFTVNRKEVGEYFPRSLHQTIARQALITSGYDSQVDVKVRVHGGGVSGQADAVRHATARALIEIDPELRGELKRRGMLTRDAREKERRKAGLKKARKRPQFSKR